MSGAEKGPERRLNLLTGDWVLVSPQRLVRPWRGEVGSPAATPGVRYDPDCYLCPGNLRAGGVRNPAYEGVYVFDNDFPALLPPSDAAAAAADPLLVAEPQSGVCRVICYSPDHGQTMAHMPPAAIRGVVDVWTAQTLELNARPDIGAVTVFENRGQMMGASNPHPHGQIWATSSVPNELAREDARQRIYFEGHGEPLLTAYLRRELDAGERIVVQNDAFVALVPYWATWPFETLVLPRRAVSGLEALTDDERDGLAGLLGRLTGAYDALFATACPYSMGFHQRPSKVADDAHFVMHAHFYPPLLRSATIRKFMVGFEMLAMPQRDLTPEDAAARLRSAVA
ncbi:MAG TPA: UDP-glucose--hexose-1-phosphate uridylyltransferase [Caulobacteraceae bacterium]|jgi:UDPglucose--hexose-1-phosphate uridylyltransferase|nr:UDP-glucose--hexose-1-phosphate uridylyltransferase [Caulobacteraceae bacterium]